MQIKQEAEGLDDMVRNLLAITRIDAGALELRRDWIDLREIVDRVANAARRRGTQQRIEVALPCRFALGARRCHASRTGGRQCDWQCHCPHFRGNPQSLVDAVVVPEDRNALRVTDDGPGIPVHALPHVFDKFIKANTTAADGGKGTGLGLAIAKGIMEAHGGTIAAESPHANGRGTRIVLTFPRQDVPA